MKKFEGFEMLTRLQRLMAAFLLGAVLFTTVPLWGQDLNTLLVGFITDLRAGTLGLTTDIQFGDHLLFSPDNTYDIGASGATRPRDVWVARNLRIGQTGITSGSDGVLVMFDAAGADFARLQFGGTTSSFPALKRSGTTLQLRLGDDSAAGGLGFAALAVSGTAPTISSGFGTTPSIVASNGTAAFTINVGTGGTASTGVIGLPTASTGWAVQCMNTSTNTATVFLTKQTASATTTATIGNYDAAGAAAAWVASDVLVCSAMAY